MVVQDEFEPHREGDRHLDVLAELSEDAGLYLPGLSDLMERPSPWDEFDDEPTFEKWHKGGKWN